MSDYSLKRQGEIQTYRSKVVEGVVIDVPTASPEYGILVVYTEPDLQGKTLELNFGAGINDKKAYANVVKRLVKGQEFYAAVFPNLPAQDYYVKHGEQFFGGVYNSRFKINKVTVFAGQVAEVDWRDKKHKKFEKRGLQFYKLPKEKLGNLLRASDFDENGNIVCEPFMDLAGYMMISSYTLPDGTPGSKVEIFVPYGSLGQEGKLLGFLDQSDAKKFKY